MARSPIRQPSPETMETFEVLQLVFERLDHLEIPYFLAGSFASALHGIVRYTQDADLVADLQRTKVGEFHKRSEEHTSELQSHSDLVCRLLLEKKKTKEN